MRQLRPWALACLALLTLAISWQPLSHWSGQRFRSFVSERYGLWWQLRDVETGRDAEGWTLALHDLRWGFRDYPAATQSIASLKLHLTPFAWQGSSGPLRAVHVQGVRLSLALIGSTLQLPAIGRTLTTDELADQIRSWNAREAKSDFDQLTVRVDDVHVLWVQGYGPSLKTTPLEGGGTWTSEGLIQKLTIQSGAWSIGQAVKQLETALTGLSDRFPTLPAQISKLRKAELVSLNLDCTDIQQCRGDGELRDIGVQAERWQPGVEHLNVRFHLKNQNLMAQILPGQWTLEIPALWAKIKTLETDGLQAELIWNDQKLTVDLPSSSLQLNQQPMKLSMKLMLPWANPRETDLAFDWQSPGVAWSELPGFLPEVVIGDETGTWLRDNIHTARLRNMTAKGWGKVVNYGQPDAGLGGFQVLAEFDRLRMHFREAWPELRACHGRFAMLQLSILIDGIRCETEGVVTEGASVRFPNLLAKPPQLAVDFAVRSPLPNAEQYLEASPLSIIPQIFRQLQLKADRQDTRIHIGLDLKKGAEVSVAGETLLGAGMLEAPLGLYSASFQSLSASYDKAGLKQLDGHLAGPEGETKASLARKDGVLLLNLTPTGAHSSPLRAAAVFEPAAAPDRVRASVSQLLMARHAARLEAPMVHATLGASNSVRVDGQATIYNFGELAKSLGLGDRFAGGKGDGQFAITWTPRKGLSAAQALNGNVELQLKDGRLRELPPPLVSLLNIANLRRLGLGSKHLVYDELQTKLHFQQGTITVKPSGLDVGVIQLLAQGRVELWKGDLDMQIQATPDLGAATLATAIGIWNPWVGLGLFGISQLQDEPRDSWVNRFFTQSYKLEGRYDEPQLRLIRPFQIEEPQFGGR